eukprot:5244332-Amphidinium_carterae.2
MKNDKTTVISRKMRTRLTTMSTHKGKHVENEKAADNQEQQEHLKATKKRTDTDQTDLGRLEHDDDKMNHNQQS